MDQLERLIDEAHSQGKPVLAACQEALQMYCPEIKARWAQIFGMRWSYISGNSSDWSLDTRCIQLSNEYGICIDNPQSVPQDKLNAIIETLKGRF